MSVLTPVDDVERARRWLSGHVDAAVVHAALELGVLAALSCRPSTPADLARYRSLDVGALAVLLEALAAIDVVDRAHDGCYRLVYELPSGDLEALLSAARCRWTATRLDYATTLAAAERAIHDPPPASARLVEMALGHVWSGAIVELATRGLLTALQFGPLAASDEEQAALLRAGHHTGLLTFDSDGGQAQLTPAGRAALGEASVASFGAWMQLRLRLERDFFWQPLGQLAQTVRSGEPPTRTSAPGTNGVFRGAFTRANRPLVPLLLRVARRVAHNVGAGRGALHVLELGTSVGHWGLAFAAAHPGSRVVAVDAPEALSEAQCTIAREDLAERYTWRADASFTCPPEPVGSRQYDVVILHEICHSLSAEQLDALFAAVAARLAPGGTLLIADMLLEPARTAPRRHLLSQVKLLVTGGGRVLDLESLRSRLRVAGLTDVTYHRLPITDLAIARAA